MCKNYYIQKYEDRMTEIYAELECNGEVATRWFDETANAEEIVGYYFVYYDWNPLGEWLNNLQYAEDITEQDNEVTRILTELCG